MAVTYQKNYLTNVVCKIDFSTIDIPSDKLKNFQQAIKAIFPVFEESKGLVLEHVLDATKNLKTNTSEIPRWNFFDSNKKKIVQLETNTILIEFMEYVNFEQYLQVLQTVLTAFFKEFPTTLSTRVGLRYINQIKLEELQPFNWSDLLNPVLLSSLEFMSDKKQVCRYIGMIEVNKEDYRLRFQFGIPNSVYPSQIIKKEFMLDYDCFTVESLDSAAILVKVKSFNDLITELFERSIGDKLRELMGAIEND